MWFTTSKKIGKYVEYDIYRQEMDDIKKRLRVLECEHKESNFVYMQTDWFTFKYQQVCLECGKTLRRFGNERDYLEAKNKRMAELIKENEGKILKLDL